MHGLRTKILILLSSFFLMVSLFPDLANADALLPTISKIIGAPSSSPPVAPAAINPSPVSKTVSASASNNLVANTNGQASVQQNTPLNIIPTNGKISFYFQNIPIKVLLQLIAKTSGLNFIISDAVQGNITLNLKGVSWSQALDVILKSHGLAYRRIGSAIYISTLDEITLNETKQLQSTQSIENLVPLKSALVTLKYADASYISSLIKGDKGSLLTPRGEIAINSPTNTVIIRDVKSNLSEIIRYIKKLDVPAKQVSIEARIVKIDTTYESQLGVKFGISNSRSLSGTLAGADQMAGGTSVAAISPLDDRLNFNIPASMLSTGTTPASIGLALARLGPILLDLELSALEEEGHTEIISKPRVVTSNQQKASIETGEEIPYQESTSSGASSIQFKKAVLSLEITPQITPDNRIILKLKSSQDTRGTQLLVAQQSTNGTTIVNQPVYGPPTINTQDVQSIVLLNNNETVVLGGIYQLTKSNTLDRVPFFSDIPYVGNLFKHRSILNERTEVLIFITPKIIDQAPRRLA